MQYKKKQKGLRLRLSRASSALLFGFNPPRSPNCKTFYGLISFRLANVRQGSGDKSKTPGWRVKCALPLDRVYYQIHRKLLAHFHTSSSLESFVSPADLDKRPRMRRIEVIFGACQMAKKKKTEKNEALPLEISKKKERNRKSLDAVSYGRPLFMVFHPERNKQRR